MADFIRMEKTAMSDEVTEPTETVEPETVEVAPQGAPETDWKAEARKWEARAKADHETANKWREYEQSQKSEHEKLAEELAAAQAKASQAEAELLRLRIAAEKGIAGDAVKLLKGTSEDELVAEAELLLSLIADQSKPKTPIPDANQGKPTQAVAGQITDRNVLKDMSPAELMAAKKAGRLDSLLGK